MKVSELWLREWVNPSLTGPQLAAQLTMAGLEVDAFYPVAGVFNEVIVAKVLKTSPHPQADKLTICEVDTGKSHVQIVCGASNVRAGLMVALALPGAHLPGDIHIKESTLRGQLSQGMLCSVTELGLDDTSDGILELADDAPLGCDLREYLALNDSVMDIDLTPNRADCLSMLGIAREVAALNQLPLKYEPVAMKQPTIDETRMVSLAEPAACPQYCGRVIRDINPHAVTPYWLKERLRRGGIRSVHPVVDVMNYVMLELGQPMHAFDLDVVSGDVTVRYAQANETLTLLDGQDVILSEDVLVIADAKKPLAMAGIMGGEESAVQSHTTHIFLESAYFNPLSIAGIARRYGLSSDSSQRFERGVDPQLQAIAIERATQLLQAIVGGQAGPIITTHESEFVPAPIEVLFDPKKVMRLTGLDIPEASMKQMLNSLGMTIEEQAQHWLIKIPSHRFDLALDVDLVEEVVRLFGYDNIQSPPLTATVQAGQINAAERLSAQIGSFLCSRGYHETISYSFVDPQLQETLYPDSQVMQLVNPISSELSQMRVGLWPGLLASMMYNIHRQQTAVKFFETGVVFNVTGDKLQERACIAGIMTGECGSLNWSETSRTFDFYDLKGDLQSLFDLLNLENDVEFIAADHPALHPGQSAKVVIAGVESGWCGSLHPRLADALGVSEDVLLFELTLETLLRRKSLRYQAISKYPQIRRDLSLLVNNEVSAAQIEQAVREVVSCDWLKAFDVFDVYIGEKIPAGKKSLAIALTLQDDSRTLVDAEINTTMSAIIQKLGDEFAIILRD